MHDCSEELGLVFWVSSALAIEDYYKVPSWSCHLHYDRAQFPSLSSQSSYSSPPTTLVTLCRSCFRLYRCLFCAEETYNWTSCSRSGNVVTLPQDHFSIWHFIFSQGKIQFCCSGCEIHAHLWHCKNGDHSLCGLPLLDIHSCYWKLSHAKNLRIKNPSEVWFIHPKFHHAIKY